MMIPQHHEVVVIGAGIAGATIANELLLKGQKVCIVDAESGPAKACSSHAFAIAHPHIGKGSPRLLRLTRIAFLLAAERWGGQWQQHGLFQAAKTGEIFDLQKLAEHLCGLGLDQAIARAVSADEALALCGVKRNGTWFSQGATLNLASTIEGLLQPHENLTCIWDLQISGLKKEGNLWMLIGRDKEVLLSARKVVGAASLETKLLLSSIGIRLPLRPVRGQLSIFKIDAKNKWISYLPKAGICGDGYCLPAERGFFSDGSARWIVGSSFDEGEDDLGARNSSDDFNRDLAKNLIACESGDTSALEASGRFVGIRCVAGDRLPIIGKLNQHPNIFLATALGSRGVLWSALAAKIIRAQVLDEGFAMLERLGFATDLLAALAPARFFSGAALVPAAPLAALASNSKPIFPPDPKAR